MVRPSNATGRRAGWPRRPASGWRSAGSTDGWPPWAVGALVASLLPAVVLRFTTRSPLWLDEALSVNIARLPLGDLGGALRRDGHPPLFYALLHGWMELFGSSDVAVRALSGVLGVLVLPLAWLAGRRIGGTSTAWWTLLLAALSPYATRYATEARMYSLLMVLVLAGLLVLLSALERPTRLRLAGVAAIVSALCWTHYWSFYLVAVVGSVTLWRGIWGPTEGRRAARRASVAIAIGVASLLPWVPSLLDQLRSTGTPWALPSRPTTVLMLTLDSLGGGDWAESRMLGLITALLLTFALLGRVDARRRVVEMTSRVQPDAAAVVGVAGATLGLGAAVAYLLGSAYATRYAAPIVPLLWIGAALGVTRVPLHWPRLLLVLGAVAMSGVGLVHEVVTPRTDARRIASRIAAEVGSRDVVAVCPDQLAVSLDRVLRQLRVGAVIIPYPQAGDPRFVDWRGYEARNESADPAAFAEEVDHRAGMGAVWLVSNSTYRTVGSDCDTISARLAQLRSPTLVVPAPGAFETATLTRFSGSSPGDVAAG